MTTQGVVKQLLRMYETCESSAYSSLLSGVTINTSPQQRAGCKMVCRSKAEDNVHLAASPCYGVLVLFLSEIPLSVLLYDLSYEQEQGDYRLTVI